MARIEHIKRRLDNWALWKARQNDTGLGFHSRSILAVDVWMRGSYNGASIPHFEDEASETDEAVTALKLGRGHLYTTLDCIYLRDLGVKATALRMQRAESTIHAQLEQADRAIAAWLEAQATERERRRATALAAQRQRQL
ncbi:hypothetical protein [Melaminivora sp.]|uniref:hypothetical protein n=1 Tax=Melaminivora sp. TaxID=1933032 RepID=UPI0028AA001B|nr:hypothetical protein [Melaminivora sp.]